MKQDKRSWMIENRRNISQRLAWIRSKENGLLLHNDDGKEEIIITKNDNFVFLHFVENDPQTGEDEISDVMSFIDVSNPLMLHSQYAHAMMLSLLFVPSPKQCYMLGFGGGRIPMVLHHHFPKLIIESSELSEGVLSILEMCFGLKQDNRLRIEMIDGRQHLQSFQQQQFDIIFLDSFSGAGKHPNNLSSLEFYQLCNTKLAQHGVVATNLVDNNPLFNQKIQTFCASFKYTYSFSFEVNHVYLGSNSLDLTQDELMKRAFKIDEQYSFGFKLEETARKTTQQKQETTLKLLSDIE